MTKKSNKDKGIFNKASSKRKLYVFMFCLILATFFWLLNALSKNFYTNVLFDVQYINSPKSKVVINKLPNQLNIKIRGLGYDLLAYKLKLKRPLLNINLSLIKGRTKKIGSLETKTLPASYFSDYISSQLGEEIEIKEIYPAAFNFIIDKKKEKMVKIVPNIKIDFEKQYQLFGKIIIKPAVIKVVGPSSILDTLELVYTENVEYNKLSKTVSESVGFSKNYYDQKLHFTDDKVLLYIPVEKYTESSVMIKINYVNVPDSIMIKAIPGEVEVKFMIPLSKMANLASAKFIAEINYNQINDNFSHKLKVEITEYPTYIQSLNINPGKVEYILKKRN